MALEFGVLQPSVGHWPNESPHFFPPLVVIPKNIHIGEYDGKETSRESCVSDRGVVRYRRGDCNRAGRGGCARSSAGSALGSSGTGRQGDQGGGWRGSTDRYRRDERSA